MFLDLQDNLFDFPKISSRLRLLVGGDECERDMAHVMSGYAPLSVRVIESMLGSTGFPLEDVWVRTRLYDILWFDWVCVDRSWSVCLVRLLK